MPRGRKKAVEKVATDETPEMQSQDGTTEEVNGETMAPEAPVAEAKDVEAAGPVDPWAKVIEESRKLLNVPLQAGQAYFESPEGFIMIDEASRDRVMCRQANKGQGLWINKRRV